MTKRERKYFKKKNAVKSWIKRFIANIELSNKRALEIYFDKSTSVPPYDRGAYTCIDEVAEVTPADFKLLMDRRSLNKDVSMNWQFPNDFSLNK